MIGVYEKTILNFIKKLFTLQTILQYKTTMRYFFTHLTETERTESHLSQKKFDELLINSLTENLHNAYIHNITKLNKNIKFKAPFFRFVWNGFNLFNPISKGEIYLENIGNGTYVTYKLVFLEFFIYCFLFSSIPFFGFFPNHIFRFVVFGIIWFIYLLSTLIATHRFEIFLKKIVAEINNNTSVKSTLR